MLSGIEMLNASSGLSRLREDSGKEKKAYQAAATKRHPALYDQPPFFRQAFSLASKTKLYHQAKGTSLGNERGVNNI